MTTSATSAIHCVINVSQAVPLLVQSAPLSLISTRRSLHVLRCVRPGTSLTLVAFVSPATSLANSATALSITSATHATRPITSTRINVSLNVQMATSATISTLSVFPALLNV